MQDMMKKANYSELASHAATHKDFLDKLNGLSAPVGDDTVKFAKEW